MNTKVTIITIANKKDILNGFKESLSTQKAISFVLKIIDNFDNKLLSAREAYNEITQECNSDLLIFMHPDIRFLDQYSLKEIIEECDKIKNFGVVGVAGSPIETVNGKRVILSNIEHGNNHTKAGISIEKPMEVQTVDECFFIVESNWFKKNMFSNTPGWHLYAVELCLDYLLKGKKNYVVPAHVWHMSDGKSLDANYIKQLKIIFSEYSNDFDYINTTVKRWKTKGLDSKVYLTYYFYKQKIKHMLLK